MNRGIFWVNEVGDKYLVAPAAQVWRWVTPSFFRTAVVNVNPPDLDAGHLRQRSLTTQAGQSRRGFLSGVDQREFWSAGLIDVATMVDIPRTMKISVRRLAIGVCRLARTSCCLFLARPRSETGSVASRIVEQPSTSPCCPSGAQSSSGGVDLLNLRSKYLEEVGSESPRCF